MEAFKYTCNDAMTQKNKNKQKKIRKNNSNKCLNRIFKSTAAASACLTDGLKMRWHLKYSVLLARICMYVCMNSK